MVMVILDVFSLRKKGLFEEVCLLPLEDTLGPIPFARNDSFGYPAPSLPCKSIGG